VLLDTFQNPLTEDTCQKSDEVTRIIAMLVEMGPVMVIAKLRKKYQVKLMSERDHKSFEW